MNFCFEFLQELSIVREAISNIRKSVSSYFQTPRSWLKKTRLRLVFPTYFLVFGNRRKHSSSCLIYYFTLLHNHVKRTSWLESHNDYTWLQLAYILGFGAELPSYVFNPNEQVLSLTSFSLYFTLTLRCTTDFIRSRVQTESLP